LINPWDNPARYEKINTLSKTITVIFLIIIMLEVYLPIIVSLFIIEVLLSVDNALVNATLAESLPEEKRKKAIRIGILLGALFRIIALLAVSIIIQNVWLKVLGGLYLVYLAIAHLGRVVNEDGKEIKAKSTYRGVIFQIALADIVFSIDNVISAVSFSENIYIVMLGVGIGVISMLFITPILSKLIHKYKGMPQAAYAIVGFVGLALLIETLTSIHISEFKKFAVVLAISLFTVWYEHSAVLRKASNPILKSLQYIIAIPVDITIAVGSILKKVFLKL
jgi:YkoY family integral membrane protein